MALELLHPDNMFNRIALKTFKQIFIAYFALGSCQVWGNVCSNKALSLGQQNHIARKVNNAKLYSWLREKSVTLQNNYRTPDGEAREHCAILAFQAAELLINSGSSPIIGAYRSNTNE